ncbi:MAG TPA: hypothetical protein VFU21_07880, partial [Kofleriaceae bacterium]|nr:hypothetical protein [Kofleriaceae bacterium]
DRMTGAKVLKEPPAPDAAFFRSAMNADEGRYGALVQRFADDLKTYRLVDRAVFEDLAREDTEIYTSNEPAVQVDKMANLIAGIPHVVQWPYKTPEENETAQVLENFTYFLWEKFDEWHRYGGNAALKWDMAWSRALYGRIVSRVLLDPTDPDLPLDHKLYDPATVFPTFGGKRGLIRVTCSYQISLERILQHFDGDGKVTAKLLPKHKNDNGEAKLDVVGTFRECWTDWYRYATWDDVEVLPVTAHRLGYIPFAYTVGTGEMGAAAMPYHSGAASRREILAGFGPDKTLSDTDLTQKGLAFFHHMKPALKQEQVLYSILLTAAKQALNPPVGIETIHAKPGKPVDMRSGSTNYFRVGDKVVPLLNSAKPVDVGPLSVALREQRVKAGLPDQMFGALSDGGQISGFALESLMGAAKDRTLPLLADVEQHMEAVTDLALKQMRDFGLLFVERPDMTYPIPTRGRAYQPNGQPAQLPQLQETFGLLQQMAGGGDPMTTGGWNAATMDVSPAVTQAHEECILTRGHILDLGTRPEVKLHNLQLQNLMQMANVAGLLIDKKVWSRAHAMDELNVLDPPKMWREILAEDAQTHPTMLENVMFPKALWESGNLDLFFTYMATVLMPKLVQSIMGGMGGPGAGAAPSPDGGAPIAASPDGGSVPGLSQPMLGNAQQSPTGPNNAGTPAV